MGRALWAAGVVLVMAMLAPPAHAHPFGPPPVALVTADGDTVRIEWSSAADDAVAVGVEIGLASEEMVDAYLEAATQAAPPSHVEDDITRADELRAYLIDNVVVRQRGERCEADVEPIDNFVWDGATVTHTCPAEIEEVEVEISMLHERHAAYRTFAIAPESADPPQTVFTAGAAVVEWDLSDARGQPIQDDADTRLGDLDDAADDGGGASVAGLGLWPVASLVGAVAAASAVVAWRNRRAHRDPSADRSG